MSSSVLKTLSSFSNDFRWASDISITQNNIRFVQIKVLRTTKALRDRMYRL